MLKQIFVILFAPLVLAVKVSFGAELMAEQTNAPTSQMYIATGAEMESFQITISLTNKTFTIGQLAALNISVKNVGTNDGLLRLWDGYSNYSFKFKDSNGNDVPATEAGEKFLHALPQYHTGSIRLSTGQSYEIPARLNYLFQMTNAGEYTITVLRQVQKRTNEQESVWVPSAPLKFWLTESQKPANSTSTNATSLKR